MVYTVCCILALDTTHILLIKYVEIYNLHVNTQKSVIFLENQEKYIFLGEKWSNMWAVHLKVYSHNIVFSTSLIS